MKQIPFVMVKQEGMVWAEIATLILGHCSFPPSTRHFAGRNGARHRSEIGLTRQDREFGAPSERHKNLAQGTEMVYGESGRRFPKWSEAKRSHVHAVEVAWHAGKPVRAQIELRDRRASMPPTNAAERAG
ncbi:MAG: hypothetical protein WA906_04645, partial [Pacificimonas sp.]